MLKAMLVALALFIGCGGDGGSSDTSDPRTFGLDPGGEGDTTIFCENEGEGTVICFDGDGNRIDSPSDDDQDNDVEPPPPPPPVVG